MIYLINAQRSSMYPKSERNHTSDRIRLIYYFPESALAELELVEWANNVVYDNDARIFRDILIYSNSSILIHAFRALIKENILDKDQFIVKFYAPSGCTRIVFDDDGRLETWIDGFTDTYRKILSRLL